MKNIQKSANHHKEDMVHHERYNPFWTLHEDLNKTMSHFYNLFEPANLHFGDFENIKLSPAMDLVEGKNNFRVEVEMPGLDEKNIQVTIDADRLTIIGEKTQSNKRDCKNFIDREIRYGHYERSIPLPKTADWEHVNATFSKGVLCITIPKIVNKKCCEKSVKIRNIDEK